MRRKLKPGGIVYISYNCMPGWAAMMPLRRLLVEHTLARGSLSAPSRASTFLDLADKFGSLDMRYFANHPKLAKRLERLKSHHPNYIVHEYFNQDSNPVLLHGPGAGACRGEAQLGRTGERARHLGRGQPDRRSSAIFSAASTMSPCARRRAIT